MNQQITDRDADGRLSTNATTDTYKFLDCIEHATNNMLNMGKTHVIKEANKYIAIVNNFYSFLDLIHFLPAGTNYRSFLQAYEMDRRRCIFHMSGWMMRANSPKHYQRTRVIRGDQVSEVE